ncbi:MAG TPA: DUF1631 family protein [Rudaea sp.]|nr:DUF1631 family protein [Rudaea sp.]
MNQQRHHRGTRTPADDSGLLQLAGQKLLPQRSRRMLEGLLGLCRAYLERPLVESLTECEKQLVRLADKLPGKEHDAYFDSVFAFKRGRDEVVSRFLSHIEDSLARIASAPRESTKGDEQAKPQLALTEQAQLDEALVLEDIVTKVEVRVREPLYALGHRFGVLAGVNRFTTEAMPLGPRALLDGLRFAAKDLHLPLEHQLVLYRCFERVLFGEIGSFYQAMNNHFVDCGVIRYLHELPSRGASGATGSDAASRRDSDAGRDSGFAAERCLADEVAQSPDLFATLRAVLGECRRAEFQVAGAAELQRVLAVLQARQHARLAGEASLRSGEQIVREILAALRENSAAGRMPRIDDESTDTIELIAMLFEYLSRGAPSGGLTHRMLVALQLPVMRVALEDKTFFSNAAHPVRRFLDELIAATRFCTDEVVADAGATLENELLLLADRIADQYDGDTLMFADALQVVLQQAGTRSRRFEAVERRHVAAAEGHERLDIARAEAADAVAERIANHKSSEFIRTLLERAWVDALAVSALREGSQSTGYTRRLDAVDQILALDVPEDARAVPIEVRVEIESGLIQAGLHEADVRAISRRLFAEPDKDDEPISQTELAIKLRRRPRFGTLQGGAAGSVSGLAEDDQDAAMNREELQALERVRALPVGTWLEFPSDAGGDGVRYKLSWLSNATGRCLLISRRGVAEQCSLHDLARKLASEKAQIVDFDEAPAVNRAWSAISDMLKHYSAHRQGFYLGVKVVEDRDAVPEKTPIVPLRPTPSRTLLLVDDEENILRALSRTLRADGYRILTAGNATEALEVLRTHEVNVVVSDQRMPGITGTDFLATVKDQFPDVLRILLSGYSDAATITNAINRGTIYKFLTKPWNDEELRLEIGNAFRACEQHVNDSFA